MRGVWRTRRAEKAKKGKGDGGKGEHESKGKGGFSSKGAQQAIDRGCQRRSWPKEVVAKQGKAVGHHQNSTKGLRERRMKIVAGGGTKKNEILDGPGGGRSRGRAVRTRGRGPPTQIGLGPTKIGLATKINKAMAQIGQGNAGGQKRSQRKKARLTKHGPYRQLKSKRPVAKVGLVVAKQGRGQTRSWPNKVVAKQGRRQTRSSPNKVVAKQGRRQTRSLPNKVVTKQGRRQTRSSPNKVVAKQGNTGPGTECRGGRGSGRI